MPLRNLTRRTVVAARVDCPTQPVARTLGLLARPPLQPDEALWLNPCGGIHTWAMRYPIDVVFLDAQLRVLRVVPNVSPWRLVFAPRNTRSVVELRAGKAVGLEVGDQLAVD